eukprot:3048500-Rhodomonas_salina.1
MKMDRQLKSAWRLTRIMIGPSMVGSGWKTRTQSPRNQTQATESVVQSVRKRDLISGMYQRGGRRRSA